MLSRIAQSLFRRNSTQTGNDENSSLLARPVTNYSSIEVEEIKISVPTSSGDILTELKRINDDADRREKIARFCGNTRLFFDLGMFGLLLGSVGLVYTSIRYNNNLDLQEDILRAPYLDHFCPEDKHTFSSFDPLCTDDETGSERCDYYYPDQYCYGHADAKLAFEGRHKLNEDCLTLLNTYCEEKINFDHVNDHITNMALIILTFASSVISFCLYLLAIQRHRMIHRITETENHLENMLTYTGILPVEDDDHESKETVKIRIERELNIQQNAAMREEELTTLQTELKRLGIVPDAIIPLICLFVLNNEENELRELFSILPSLRCAKYQIRFTSEMKNNVPEQETKTNTRLDYLIPGSRWVSRYQFLRDSQSCETRKYQFPAKVQKTIYGYIDFEECGVVTMPFPNVNETHSHTPDETLLPSQLSLEEEFKTTNAETLSVDQLSKIRIALESDIEQNAVYVRLTDMNDNNRPYLLYFNRRRNELVHLILSREQISYFDEITNPTSEVQMLSVEVLDHINERLHHDHFVSAEGNNEPSFLSMQRSA